MSSGVNSKSRTWNKGRITLTSSLRSWPPQGLEDFPAGWRQEEETEKPCLSSASRWTTWDPLQSSHFFLQPLLFYPVLRQTHTHRLQGINPLSFMWISFDRRQANKNQLLQTKALLDNLDKIVHLTGYRLLSSLLTSPKIWHSIELKQVWKRGSPCENLIKNLIANLFITYEYI